MGSIKSNFKGWFGEKMTAMGMFLSLDKSTYRKFHNFIVNAPDGTTRIDHVIYPIVIILECVSFIMGISILLSLIVKLS